LEKIQDLITRKGPGHLFQLAHIILALKLIKERGPIGRHELGRVLDLGGGSVRTLANRLKNANLIVVDGKKGHIITEEGTRILEEFNNIVIHFENVEPAEALTHKKFNVGCQARAVASRIGSGISMRDAALAVGAKSITSLIFTGNKFNIPTLDEDYFVREHPNLAEYLLSKFDFQKDDVLIVCGADTAIEAELGVITAVLSLIIS
jgi:predicted transcriptional regulator